MRSQMTGAHAKSSQIKGHVTGRHRPTKPSRLLVQEINLATAGMFLTFVMRNCCCAVATHRVQLDRRAIPQGDNAVHMIEYGKERLGR